MSQMGEGPFEVGDIEDRLEELERAQKALRENERFLQDVFDGIQDGISVLDCDLNIVRVNQWMEKMYADTMPLTGKKCYQAYHDRETSCPWCPCIPAIATGEKRTRLVPYPFGGDEEGVIEVAAFPIKDENGRVTRIVEHVKDVTEREKAATQLKENEERFRSVFDTATDGILMTDPEKMILAEGNAAICRMLGYSLDELKTMSVKDILPEKDLPYALDQFARQVRGEQRIARDIPVKRKDGSVFFTDINSAPIMFAGKKYMLGLFRDVTERKKAEDALNSIFRAAPTGIGLMSDRVLKNVNDRVCEMLGYRREELLEKSARILYPTDEDFEYVGREKYRQINEQGTGTVETCWQCKDGRVIDVLLSSTPIDPFDLTRGVTFTALDITDRKRMEDALRLAKRDWESIFQAIGSPAIIMGPNHEVLAANEATVKASGFSQEELKQRKCYDLFHFGTDKPPKDCPMDRLLSTVEFETVEMEMEALGGTYLVSCTPVLDKDGKLSKVIHIAVDITDRKRIEEALRMTQFSVDHMSVSAFWMGSEAAFFYVNDAACLSLEYTREELLSMTVQDIDPDFPPDAWPKHWEELREKGSLSFESHHRKKDGTVFPVEITSNYVSFGGREYNCAFAKDISERKRAEDAVQELNKELELRVEQRTLELDAANKELESFAYSVSHDLQAPLRSMDGFSAALLDDYAEELDETAGDYLRRIRHGAQHMGQLINDILLLSRASRAEISRQNVDVSAMAWEIVSELRTVEPDRRVDVEIAGGLLADGDPHLLRVVFSNLLVNAWKFTGKQKKARIEVGTRPPDDSGKRTYFVRDNGVGFDMAYADKLFGAFERLHREDDFPGTGIGLATVERIVRRHGGKAWAESSPDQGATIFFSLL